MKGQVRNIWKHYPKYGMIILTEHFHASLKPSAMQLTDIFR